jgi:hypothetical protein
LHGKFVERFTDSEELVVVGWRGDLHFLNVHSLQVTAMAKGPFAAGAVNENTAHGFGGGSEKVSAILKLRLTCIAHQPQPGFVDQGGGLQGVARRFVGHLMRG